MKTMIVRISLAVLIFLGLLMIVWVLISTGRIREYKNGISEKFTMEINGGLNGFFINGEDINNPILLLISSGPGTDDYFLTERFDDMRLDEIFTVVYWDYRGMGIAYDSSIDPSEITMDLLVEDAKAVTDYLKKRFDREKIYVMGFSGGTQIGLSVAEKYPDDYYAYIGMAQVVTDSSERDILMSEFMRDEFAKRGDNSRLKKLNNLVYFEGNEMHCKDWYDFVYLLHEAGGGTTHNETELTGITIPIILSHCYTVSEKIKFIRGMKMYRRTTLNSELENYDYMTSMTDFDVPMFFMSGEYDYNCPWPLVEDYCGKISAPDKGFFLISDAAHSPLWENAEESFKAMAEIK